MSIQTIEKPTLGTQIGGNLGRTLAEQIPQEVGRQRLANALKGMQGKNLQPLEQMSELVRSGGISGEEASRYLPYLQQAQGAQALKQRVEARNAPKTAAGTAATGEVSPGVPAPKTGEITPEEIKQTNQNMLQPIRTEDIEKAAVELQQSGQEPDYNRALATAKVNLEENRQAQQAQVKATGDELNKNLSLELQGAGLGDYKDISGHIQKDLMDRAVTKMIGRGVSPELASQEASDTARDLALASTQMKTVALSNASSKDKTRALQEQSKIFEKNGYGEQFDEMAAGMLGVTPQKVASILHPIENPEVKSKLNKIKWYTPSRPGTKELGSLALSIKPTDNLMAIANELRSKNVDPNDFFAIIRNLKQQNKIALTDQQSRELQKPVQKTFFGDILFSLF